MKIFIKFFSIIFFSFLFIFNFSFAITSEVEYKLSPRYPRPHEIVNLNLKTNFFDLDSSEVFYYIDNNLIQKGFGLKDFIFKTKGLGDKTNIKIEIKEFDGKTQTKNIEVTPAEVSLIYEVQDPYRPFGYKGKSEALSDSKVKIYAYTNFVDTKKKKINPKKLIFNWYKNFELEYDKSGVGKNIYYIDRLPANPRKTDISVKVYSLDRKLVAKDQINFAPKRTDIDFYLISDVLPFNFKNVANPNIKSSSLDSKIKAVPYFMNDLPMDVEITWKVNNKKVSSIFGEPLSIILSNSIDKFTTETNLFLRIKNPKRILQSAEEHLNVIFSKDDLNSKKKIKYFQQRKNSSEEKRGFFNFF